MKKLTNIFEKYLERIDRLKTIPLGEHHSRKITQDDNSFLNHLLDVQTRFNKNLLIIYVLLLCIIFIIGVILVFYFISSPAKIGVVFGGTFLSLLAVVDRLGRIWKEKNIIDMTLILVNNMPPDQTAAVIQTLYYSTQKKGR